MARFPLELRIVAVGKLRQSHWLAAARDYQQRLQHYFTLEVVDIRDRVGRGLSEAEAVAAEGADIQQALRRQAHLVVLEAQGRRRDTQAFTRWLQHLLEHGPRAIDFVLGGPLGLSATVRNCAQERLSLSPMTLPHELARIVLLEQLYRAGTILRGEKYHK
ncbi:MAG: 23S rRNA (pseudouridine(1915)-N(3))-methyltransferase RlmH [candidate division KSB1 bacterium]|nr:23S rRNA (pseudouridine(1915)-N(3))-methyltransferase RlmH [candidate division KSB1 bacterium]MDZ7272748.1 23S rRNA (pseudouridine(1915)-N(3))-methyltransferase RlmH [candidate division KSB1 bacterium]MDZ7284227.1 23S rRNA (pseudouridine(1915)-N(3))-methyltransferase RlmH [candidate division KSB1 bacterium]MDZ7297374.1 23S rRNA (pseudouridine(1915)-N(3))-methyltransferase RlmH [candidate division KSB1 bacterium]MDZ7309052.1 23S rRNA (pseudouridine(1915)-N(3))-methyltransferase RlmH [candidat